MQKKTVFIVKPNDDEGLIKAYAKLKRISLAQAKKEFADADSYLQYKKENAKYFPPIN